MKKYIDADELKKVFRYTEDAEYARWTLWGIIGEIDDIEAADVVEVVRCKDCKHYKTMFCKMDVWHKDITLYRADENDYCSYGEKKE